MFVEFDFQGVPSIKNTPILTFDFYPSRDLGVRQIKKLHKTKSDRRPILRGVPIIKNIKIPKFWSAPQPAPPSGPVFSGRGPKLKIPLPMFFLPCCPNSEKVRHNLPAPKTLEEIDLAETHFSGSEFNPKGCRVRVTRPNRQHFFNVTDGWTHRHTDKNESPQYHYRIFFAYM